MTITDSISELNLMPDAERLGILLHALDNPHSTYASLDEDEREAIRAQVLEYARKHRIKPKNFGPKPQKPTSQKRERVRTCKPKHQEAVPSPVPVAPLLLDTAALAREFSIEAQKIYQPEKLRVPGRFALCWRDGKEPFQQQLYDVSELDNVMHRVASMPERDRRHFWLSQSTYVPYAVDRRISSVMLLNAVWVDIDLAHPNKTFPKDELPPWSSDKDAELLARVLVTQVEDELGLTASQVVATGGGLLLRFNFEEALPTIARARWSSVQRHLVKLVSDLRPAAAFPEARQWRWPVDASASDAARILRLVGTVNPRWSNRCRVVYDSGKRYSFDDLADKILPYTRAEVAEFRASMAEANRWTKNRQAAAAVGIRTGKLAPADAKQDLIADEAARALWTGRFEFGRELLTARGGASEGHRNNWFWPMANALAWSSPGVEQLTQELAALHHQHFTHDGWTRAEAMHAAGSVVKRMQAGKDKLYKMRSMTFAEMLEATPDELKSHGHLLSSSGTHNLRRSEWQQGVMGFEPMQGLSAEAFIAETRRRQAEAGRYAAETRKTTTPPELRAEAARLASEGLRQVDIVQRIEQQFGVKVGQGTISKWLKAAK